MKLKKSKKADPSQRAHFFTIVSEYGKVLEQYSYMVYGVPRSKLPWSLPELKGALIEVALASLDEPALIEQLRSAYVALATFIDDEAAMSYERARVAMASIMGQGRPELSELKKATEAFAAAAKAQDAILEEMETNRIVFNEVLSKLKVKINWV